MIRPSDMEEEMHTSVTQRVGVDGFGGISMACSPVRSYPFRFIKISFSLQPSYIIICNEFTSDTDEMKYKYRLPFPRAVSAGLEPLPALMISVP